MKKLTLNINDLIRKHASGLTCKQIACELDISIDTVIKRLNSAGVDTSRRKDAVDISEAVRLLDTGRGVSGVADAMGITRRIMVRALRDAGIKTRNRSEQQFARWGAMSKEERLEFLKINHESLRGKPAKLSRLEASAKAKELNCSSRKSPAEFIFADMLRARGIDTIPQKAFGKYNCDLAADPVAVEIAGGHWHWHGAHLARTKERFDKIMNSGWNVIMIAVTDTSPLTEAVADYVAAYIKQSRSDPSAPREYRVIWRAGEFSTSGGINDDNFSIKPPFTCSRNVYNGRYETVAC